MTSEVSQSDARLWERGAVTEAVTEAIHRALEGSGSALFIVGEAGLGKTSILERAREAAAADMDVGFGRGEEMERAVPFGMLTQAIGSLGEGDDALAGGAPAVEPSAPFHHVLRWLETRRRPLLLALDDLHWADADSLNVFAFTARRLGRLPVAMIATLRPWPVEAHDVSTALVASGHARSQHLGTLSASSVGALLAERSGATPSATDARRVWELSGGNPFLVEQLATSFGRGERIPHVGEPAAVGEHLLLARFAGLDSASMRCARAGSVLGTSFRAELAAEVAGLDEDEIDRALEALSRSGLVLEGVGPLARFAHPLFAQALYADLAPAVRRRLHARCFELLAARGLDDEAGEHAVRADLIGDERAIELLARGGRVALESGAVASAAEKLASAARLAGDRPPTPLLHSLAEALTACGRVEEVVPVCQRLLSGGELEWPDRIEMLRMLGRAHYLSGAPDHGEAALEDAVEVAMGHDPLMAVQPLLDQSLSAWLAGGPVRALPLAARARDLACNGDEELRERAGATWSHLALEVGDPGWKSAAADAGARRRTRERALDPADLTWPWASAYQHAMNATYLESYAEAHKAFTAIREEVDRAGAANAIANVAIHLAHLENRRGRLREALGEAARAEEFSELTPGVLPYAHLVRAEALLLLGRFEESERLCRRVDEVAGGQWFADVWLAHLRGLRLLGEGDAAASDWLLAAEEITNGAGVRNPSQHFWAAHAVEAHLVRGRVDDALRVVEWLEECAATVPGAWPGFAAMLGRARLAERAGDEAAADGAFRAALGRLDGVDLPLQRVEGMLAHGRFLRRRGRPTDARAPLAEAVRLADASEARWLAAAAQEELRLAGGRRRRASEDRDRLTAAERRVAEQAVAGLTNAEIARRLHLSANTVGTHLKHVYAKLEIHSRRELIALDLDEHSAA
jgi:DNA-binding CsgD family transcriptional regulator